jgi:hypothetical protein
MRDGFEEIRGKLTPDIPAEERSYHESVNGTRRRGTVGSVEGGTNRRRNKPEEGTNRRKAS